MRWVHEKEDPLKRRMWNPDVILIGWSLEWLKVVSPASLEYIKNYEIHWNGE